MPRCSLSFGGLEKEPSAANEPLVGGIEGPIGRTRNNGRGRLGKSGRVSTSSTSLFSVTKGHMNVIREQFSNGRARPPERMPPQCDVGPSTYWAPFQIREDRQSEKSIQEHPIFPFEFLLRSSKFTAMATTSGFIRSKQIPGCAFGLIPAS